MPHHQESDHHLDRLDLDATLILGGLLLLLLSPVAGSLVAAAGLLDSLLSRGQNT